MKIESQVCSLELAKKLKELGVKQESYWYWAKSAYSGEYILLNEHKRKWRESHQLSDDGGAMGSYDPIPTFTVAELGEILPTSLEYVSKSGYRRVTGFFQERVYIGSTPNDVGVRYYEVGLISDGNTIDFRECEKTEADARAKMLIYLLENNLITL